MPVCVGFRESAVVSCCNQGQEGEIQQILIRHSLVVVITLLDTTSEEEIQKKGRWTLNATLSVIY